MAAAGERPRKAAERRTEPSGDALDAVPGRWPARSPRTPNVPGEAEPGRQSRW